MLNLLGCNKENFKKLLINMSYKVTEKKQDIFFRYIPQKNDNKKTIKKFNKESPFGILKNLNLN